MIKPVLRWLSRRPPAAIAKGLVYQKPLVIAKPRHGIARKRVSKNAVDAARRLTQAGHAAYIVGGAVRDLLRGAAPKDFDLATDARPSDIRRLFHNARVIGRRFKIVHLYFPDEVLEVSTFRAAAPTERCEESGRILSDNTYGGERADASRRDFTANALFFNPLNETIVDYVGGFEDVRRRRLRMIGEPAARYREDPVRMLRAIRLAAKLDFTMARDTEAAIAPLAAALADIPTSRLFDELVKILKSGAAVRAFAEMRRLGVLRELLPHLADSADDRLARAALEFADKRIADGMPISISLLLAAILWPLVSPGRQSAPATQAAMGRAIERADFNRTLITRRLEGRLAGLWLLQARMNGGPSPSRKRAFAAARDPGFRSALAFLRLRVAAGDADADAAEWWSEFFQADSDKREKMIAAAAKTAVKTGGRKRRRRRTRATARAELAQNPAAA